MNRSTTLDYWWKAPEAGIQLEETDKTCVFRCTVAGIDPDNLRVEVTPHDVTILSMTGSAAETELRKSYADQFPSGRLLQSLQFPRPVNPNSAAVTLADGIVSVKAEFMPAW